MIGKVRRSISDSVYRLGPWWRENEGFLFCIKHLPIKPNVAAMRWILDEDHEDRGEYPMSLPPPAGSRYFQWVTCSCLGKRLKSEVVLEITLTTDDVTHLD
ncbi:MAG: hypothetical protein BECKG1743F_GA0114225_110792 [Candidatus Kentron sp. G]|nr:MAG: hypothetical protein BECKG1743E_GA0114224_105382 [Candidatus Kentron sp. G]VFN05457.1 MAG: hypothetical protein BECKG1743F_GA0114225_110792 [Candidatus Kentron sp. G]